MSVDPAIDPVVANMPKLKRWKEKLLQLSRRNRLMNLNLNTKSGVTQIAEPSLDAIWACLVEKDSSSVRFAQRTRLDYEDECAEYERALRSCEAEGEPSDGLKQPDPFVLEDGWAVTPFKGKDQDSRLRQLRKKARLIEDERAIPALYASFGSIHWMDKKGNDYQSPLLLVPATLEKRGKTAPYALVATDDASENETLRLALKREKDYKLPVFVEGTGPSAYLRQVEQEVARWGWTVDSVVGVGLFTFNSINMYEVLDVHAVEILRHPIVRAICGDGSGLEDIRSGVDDLEHGDGSCVGGMTDRRFQILSSDSSQDEAIRLANLGRSFVLQGPPGTGKSQTIANIIAESLARGKTVLFVSEKRAALDVVKRRLDYAGLTDAVFVLHDLKTNKKEVISELKRIYDGASFSGSLRNVDATLLRAHARTVDGLASYADEIYQVIDPLGITPWDAYGELVRLHDAPRLRFAIKDAERVSADQFEDMKEAVRAFSSAARRVPGGYWDSPWRGLAPMRATEDARIALARDAEDAVEAIREVSAAFLKYSKGLGIGVSATLNGADGLADLVSCLSALADAQVKDIGEEGIERFIAAAGSVRNILKRAEPAVKGLNDQLSKIRSYFGDSTFALPSVVDVSSLARLRERLESLLPEGGDGFTSATGETSVDALIDNLRSYGAARERILKRCMSDIFELDVRGMLVRAHQEYGSKIKRMLSATYKADVREVTRCLRTVGSEKMTYETFTALLEEVDKLKTIRSELEGVIDRARLFLCGMVPTIDSRPEDVEAAHARFKEVRTAADRCVELMVLAREASESMGSIAGLLGRDYRGLATDVIRLDHVAAAVDSYLKLVITANEKAGDLGDISSMMASLERLDLDPAEFRSIVDKADDVLERFADRFVIQRIPADASFDEIESTVSDCRDSIHTISEVLACENLLNRLSDLGLAGFAKALEQERCDIVRYPAAFERRFYRCWLDAVLTSLPAVEAFDEIDHEREIARFIELDEEVIKTAGERVMKKVRASLHKKKIAVPCSEIDLLLHEAGKTRWHMPIRRLVNDMPNLIVALKPCMMMSPLSVSTFLKSRKIMFDLVIFDEGSQVCTENAVGAISRGRQLIIGGDSKQLPPTDLFSSVNAEDEIDQSEEGAQEISHETDAYDSVLEEASVLPSTTLSWHYRSKNESLIEFSNREIYDGGLITFPSNKDGAAGEGVSFEYVDDGIWEGSNKGNPIEAQRVAEIVKRHYLDKRMRNRSLGVIALGRGQNEAIEQAVRKMREDNPSLEPYFAEDKNEPFFMKNLENVQGDERDSIIISLGFGPGADGKLRLSFGPINKEGGERRLNVAVTRAKYDLTLVSSMRSSDLSRVSPFNKGQVLLRDYLAFAERCGRPESEEGEDTVVMGAPAGIETPLGDYIEHVIREHGYATVRGIGATRNKVDIGVKRRESDTSYLAGILLDGPSYHAGKTVRERDKIRPKMLESMGWELLNVWAPSWESRPRTAESRLLEDLDEIASRRIGLDGSRDVADTVGVVSVSETTGNDASTIDESARSEATASGGASSGPTRSLKSLGSLSSPVLLDANGFREYVEYRSDTRPRSLPDLLYGILDVEAPIKLKLLLKDARGYEGSLRVTADLRERVTAMFSSRAGRYRLRGGYVYPRDFDGASIVPRRDVTNRRGLYEIAPEELDAGVLALLARRQGDINPSRAQLCRETLEAFGYKRMTQGAEERIGESLKRLVRARKIKIENGTVTRAAE